MVYPNKKSSIFGVDDFHFHPSIDLVLPTRSCAAQTLALNVCSIVGYVHMLDQGIGTAKTNTCRPLWKKQLVENFKKTSQGFRLSSVET